MRRAATHLRRATPEDWLAYLGHLPPRRTRAWVGLVGERIVGIFGIDYIAGSAQAFSYMEAVATDHRGLVLAGLRAMRQLLDQENGRPVWACATPNVQEAPDLLHWLGFRPIGWMSEGQVFRRSPHPVA